MISGMVAVARWEREPPPRTTCRGTANLRGGGNHQVADLKIGVFGEADGAVVLLVGVEAIVPEEQVRLELHHQGQMLAHLFQVLGIDVRAAG